LGGFLHRKNASKTIFYKEDLAMEHSMIINWNQISPIVVGLVTLLLMWSDWFLTTLQERERSSHYAEHYQSYPVNTIEGNPMLQSAVRKARFFEARHIIIAIALSGVVAYVVSILGDLYQELFLGYVWGLFLIVDSTHLGNLIGYKASRRGLHGKLYLHQRTGLMVQMGRYAATTVLLIILAVCSASIFIIGVSIAGLTSALRQLIWLRKVPHISVEDYPPADNNEA
jgi:hypothetical protein